METSVVRFVGMIEIRMLGPLSIARDGASIELPPSRKVRGLLAYLALAPHAVTRSHLCELLWEIPNDPRGELRWSLSKIRRLIDDDRHKRVETRGETIVLDLDGCFVDALQVARAFETGETLDFERSRELVSYFTGEFLDGLEVDSPGFSTWLLAQRRRFREFHVALLEQLTSAMRDDSFAYLEKWLELAPFDRHVHERMLRELVRRDRIHEGEQHMLATVRSYEAEGLESSTVLEAWQSARSERLITPEGGRAARRASVAIMPFTDWSSVPGARGGAADALAHDVITRLAKLRSLFVIAQGSVFALHDRRVGAAEAGRMLGVDYIASGSVRREGTRMSVSVELAETATSRIIWSEVFHHRIDDAFSIMEQIADSIVASIASEIEASERNRAILRPPNSLDAWEAHHRGLWHMYRFNRLDNERAQHFFEMAVRMDPTFARAYAGLSFTHFQNVFQGWGERRPEIDLAFEAAGESLMADDRDPAAHWAMGRALWLHGHNDQSVAELETAIDLSPNFALGHYTLSFVRSQAGDPEAAICDSDLSRKLSPFDPLVFAMLGARAMALARMGRFEEAAQDAVRAAARPNAHVHIMAIAALTLALAGRLDEARQYVVSIRRSSPKYGIAEFLTAMHFEAEGEHLFRGAANRLGLH